MNSKLLIIGFLVFSSVVNQAQNDVRAWYADGQVFVVWELSPDSVETYGIFASSTPFENTDQAAMIGRPFYWEFTGHALKDNLEDPDATFLVPNGQDSVYQLTPDEGLFVFTPHLADSLYFAVTVWGENEVIEGQNITESAVEFDYDPINDPVECHLQRTFSPPLSEDYICFAFCMWTDGRQNHWEGRPDFPIMSNAAKNGMPGLFLVSVPLDLDTETAYPLSVWLHGGEGKARQSLAGSRKSVNIDPAQGILLAHNDRLYGYRGTSEPNDEQPSWHFGWSKNYNPFNSIALTEDTVINYTQRRYLWIDDWITANMNIDTNRINIHGHSMGAAGATAMAKCYPQHYGSATIFNTSCKGPQTGEGAAAILGSYENNFPTNLQNIDNEAVRIFDVWDLYKSCSLERDLPVIKFWHGKQDDNSINHWGPITIENFVVCDSTGTGLIGHWSERAHGLAAAADEDDHWIMGELAFQQTVSDNVNFQEFHYRSNESFPAFFNHRLDDKNNEPGIGLTGIDNGDGDNWGTWGGYHRWENIVETPQYWEVTAWLASNAVFENDNSPEEFLTSDLAIRRPQAFTPNEGESISWFVEELGTGTVLQSGVAIVEEHNLVVIPQIEVFREDIRKVRIVITPGANLISESRTKGHELHIYPNPTSTNINIETHWKTLSIMDLSGAVLKIFQSNTSTSSLDISFLPSGIYFVQTETDDGVRKLGRFAKF